VAQSSRSGLRNVIRAIAHESIDNVVRQLQGPVVLRVIPVVCVGVLAGWLGTAGAADDPKVTATVKMLSPTSRLVHIVNRDDVAYRHFRVQSVRSPKIVAATKPCVVHRVGVANGLEFVWRYMATCKKLLAPGRTMNIRLTTQGRGRISVLVFVNNTPVTITK
jgi:hypothetical protein